MILPHSRRLLLIFLPLVSVSCLTLPRADIVHASTGLLMHYLSEYSPANRLVSFTVSIPMSKDMCYLLPLAVVRKLPFCITSRRSSTRRALSRPRRFIGDIVAIGIGSAALTLSTINSVQILNLQHEVRSLTGALSAMRDATNSHTAQIYHLSEGQLKLAHELNNTQAALNDTMALVNDHSAVLDRHYNTIRDLTLYAQYIDNKFASFVHSVETHFLHTAITDILANRLNLHFIHHTDLPTVLDFILSSVNVSFSAEATTVPLVDLVGRLLVQQHIDFAPRSPSDSTLPASVIGTLLISSFFAATTSDQASFSLYELLSIPFAHNNVRVRLADIPFVVGLDPVHGHLVKWTAVDSAVCDFRFMSTCRETPPILTQWNTSCLYQILHNISLDTCRTEFYADPTFIHRIGAHWAISTNSTTRCHSTSLSTTDYAVLLHNNVQILPPVALLSIPTNTTLICDSFSIPSLPPLSNLSLVILDSVILNASSTIFFDLYEPLSNATRWRKLPYIPEHFKSILDYLGDTPPPPRYLNAIISHLSPFTYLNIALLSLVFIILGILLYRVVHKLLYRSKN